MQLTHRQSSRHAIKTNVNKILAYSPEPPRTSATTNAELWSGSKEGHKQEGRRGKVSTERRRKINGGALGRAVFKREQWGLPSLNRWLCQTPSMCRRQRMRGSVSSK